MFDLVVAVSVHFEVNAVTVTGCLAFLTADILRLAGREQVVLLRPNVNDRQVFQREIPVGLLLELECEFDLIHPQVLANQLREQVLGCIALGFLLSAAEPLAFICAVEGDLALIVHAFLTHSDVNLFGSYPLEVSEDIGEFGAGEGLDIVLELTLELSVHIDSVFKNYNDR